MEYNIMNYNDLYKLLAGKTGYIYTARHATVNDFFAYQMAPGPESEMPYKADPVFAMTEKMRDKLKDMADRYNAAKNLINTTVFF